MAKIWITGDVHAQFTRLLPDRVPELKELGEDDYIIVCGDFGIWDNSRTEQLIFDELSRQPYTILFVDGNHENFDMLDAMPVDTWHGGKVHFIRNNVIHLMRGQVFEIDGKTFFTMGGAQSHDISDGILEPDDPHLKRKIMKFGLNGQYMYRINHVSWWKQELPSDEEYEEAIQNLKNHDWSVDCVLSHCCPSEVQDILSDGWYQHDRLTDWMDEIRSKLRFRHWFFGHYHDIRTIGVRYHLLYKNFFDLAEVIST